MTDIVINAMAVSSAPVATLLADPRNVKKHPESQLRQIEASIRKFGFNDPIAIDQNNVVVEGHGRLSAAQRMGMTDVPVLRLTFANEQERRAYAIAHNQTQQLSPLDNDAVMNEFDRLGVQQVDYEPLGFTNEDVTFMSYERGDIGSGTEQGGGSTSEGGFGGEGHSGFRAPAIQRSLIRFDTQEQLLVWYNTLDWLRMRYPDAMGLGERLTLFMNEFQPEVSND